MKNTIQFSVLFLFISFFSTAQKFDLNSSINKGKSLYTKNCVACHMMDGKGLERVFPPLAKNTNLSDKKRVINIVTKGMKGAIKVNNIPYKGEMTPFKLTDEQTADVINYISNSWGNKFEPVQPSEIQPALKAKIKDFVPYKKP